MKAIKNNSIKCRRIRLNSNVEIHGQIRQINTHKLKMYLRFSNGLVIEYYEDIDIVICMHAYKVGKHGCSKYWMRLVFRMCVEF